MNGTTDPDVLVVGGGPAGAAAATAAAEGGLETVLVDASHSRRDVSCAEAIGSYLLPLVPFDIPDRLLQWRIDGIAFETADVTVTQQGRFYEAWSLDRGAFDEWLLDRAVRAGVTVDRPCRLTELSVTDGSIDHATVVGDDERTLRPTYVVAADGVDSRVGRELDIHDETVRRGHVYSRELHDLSLDRPRLEQLFFSAFQGNRYGYVFPKSPSVANVGVGSFDGPAGLESRFEQFATELTDGSSATYGPVKSGVAPFESHRSTVQLGQVLFAGDAANQNLKPYIEGILPGVICGTLAGQALAEHSPERYPELVERTLGQSFEMSDEITAAIAALDELAPQKQSLVAAHVFAYLDDTAVSRFRDRSVTDIEAALRDRDSRLRAVKLALGYLLWQATTRLTGRDSL